MTRSFFITILCVSFFSTAKSQLTFSDAGNAPFSDRIYFGGNFSLQFGSLTYIDISPLAGYMITPNLSAGLGITYRYLKYTDINYETNIYGGRLFGRHNIQVARLPLFLYSEFETLSLEYAKPINATDYIMTREWVPSFFIGGGLFQPIGRRSGFMIMALYNVIHDSLRSPYNSPWVLRVGFTL